MTLWNDVELPELGDERSSSLMVGAISIYACEWVCVECRYALAYCRSGVVDIVPDILGRQELMATLAVKCSEMIATYLVVSIPSLLRKNGNDACR